MQSVLKWNNKAWPWAAYGPAIMTAVRAGVPVMGANLPRESMRVAMRNAAVDTPLERPGAQGAAATDSSGVLQLAARKPDWIDDAHTKCQRHQHGKHAKQSGAAWRGRGAVDGQWPCRSIAGHAAAPASNLVSKAVRLRAGDVAASDSAQVFDAVWPTPVVPDKDYCAEFKTQMMKQN